MTLSQNSKTHNWTRNGSQSQFSTRIAWYLNLLYHNHKWRWRCSSKPGDRAQIASRSIDVSQIYVFSPRSEYRRFVCKRALLGARRNVSKVKNFLRPPTAHRCLIRENNTQNIRIKLCQPPCIMYGRKSCFFMMYLVLFLTFHKVSRLYSKVDLKMIVTMQTFANSLWVCNKRRLRGCLSVM